MDIGHRIWNDLLLKFMPRIFRAKIRRVYLAVDTNM